MRRTSLLLLAPAFLVACGTEDAPAPPAEEPVVVVAPGKEDNFFAPKAQEYALYGTTTVRLEESWMGKDLEERLARAHELVPFRQVVVGWFLNQYIVEKSQKAKNKEYGGFKALTKNGSWEELDLREVDELTFEFDFVQELAGPLDLLGVLPTTVAEDGRRSFDLTLGKVSTEDMQKLELNSEWYRKAPWSGFDPATVDDDDKELLTLVIEAEPRSANAWFDYVQLIDDGVLDIGAHFGWDYHKEYHLVHSRSVYDRLVRDGFSSPVDGYDDYARDSGPLTKKVGTPLGDVEVRISLYWGKPGTATDPDTDAGGRVLEEDMRASLESRDVIIFSGHSGPFYGFALANWRKTSEGDLDDSEIPGLKLPERYQVVLAEGCDTYAIGQAFFLNEAKADRSNVDVITTTSFSNASTANTVLDFLGVFIAEKDGVLDVKHLEDLLDDLDNNSWWFSTMYGVHGIDDNPRRHPWADEDKLCSACTEDADCGAAGNSCVTLGDGSQSCSFECTADDGCPAGFTCLATASGTWLRTAQVCVANANACEVVAEPEEPTVAISLVVPNPDADLNGDGSVDARKDEAATLTNAGPGVASLAGWSLADNVGVRFTFGADAKIAEGESVTVYGGGASADVLAATRGLGLNNRGDTLRLLDDRGALVDELSWGRVAKGEEVRPAAN